MSREDILNVLRERAAQTAAKYGMTPEDAFIQAFELWCFLANQNLIGTEIALEYTMTSSSSATVKISYPYHVQYTF